jgi:hypothetical protein
MSIIQSYWRKGTKRSYQRSLKLLQLFRMCQLLQPGLEWTWNRPHSIHCCMCWTRLAGIGKAFDRTYWSLDSTTQANFQPNRGMTPHRNTLNEFEWCPMQSLPKELLIRFVLFFVIIIITIIIVQQKSLFTWRRVPYNLMEEYISCLIVSSTFSLNTYPRIPPISMVTNIKNSNMKYCKSKINCQH